MPYFCTEITNWMIAGPAHIGPSLSKGMIEFINSLIL